MIHRRIASVGYVVTDKTVNYIISEYRKLAQKEYRTRHNRVGNDIDSELYKRLKFDLVDNRYSHKSEFFR